MQIEFARTTIGLTSKEMKMLEGARDLLRELTNEVGFDDIQDACCSLNSFLLNKDTEYDIKVVD